MTQQTLFNPPPDGHEFKDPTQLEEFIKAGKAIFTLYSTRTTKHYTYRVKASGDHWYVSRLGPENDWIYLGTIFEGPRGFTFTAKTTPHAIVSEQYTAFSWFWTDLKINGRIHPQLTVFHEGKCGACGSALTDPESIKQGYGPDCRKKRYRRPADSDSVGRRYDV